MLIYLLSKNVKYAKVFVFTNTLMYVDYVFIRKYPHIWCLEFRFPFTKHVRNFVIFFEMCEMWIDTKFRIRMQKLIICKKFAKLLEILRNYAQFYTILWNFKQLYEYLYKYTNVYATIQILHFACEILVYLFLSMNLRKKNLLSHILAVYSWTGSWTIIKCNR